MMALWYLLRDFVEAIYGLVSIAVRTLIKIIAVVAAITGLITAVAFLIFGALSSAARDTESERFFNDLLEQLANYFPSWVFLAMLTLGVVALCAIILMSFARVEIFGLFSTDVFSRWRSRSAQ